MTIGQRIKEKREELGLTQDELAQRVGYKSRSSINKIELGHYNLTQTKIKAFADALGVLPTWLMGWDDEREKNERQLCDLMTKCYGADAHITVTKLLRLDEKDRGYVEGVIDEKLKDEKYKQEAYASA